MKKWTLLEQAFTPEGKPVSLMEHDGEYRIRIGSEDLMSTRQHASEDKLAELACAHLKSKRRARVLIGGLGMGFTLKAALAALPSDAGVVTAELLEPVIAWNRNPNFPLAGDAMDDPRVSILQQDVFRVIESAPSAFDSIILDIDNGPAALTSGDNARLYNDSGLHRTRAALKPGGCVAFWSAAPDAPFEKALARAGFEVETHLCRAHANSGRRHTLFMGRLTC